MIIIFAVITIIILGASLALPWYVQTGEIGSGKNEIKYSFSGIEYKSTAGDRSYTWDDNEIEFLEETKGVYQTTQILVILGIIFSILLIISAVLVMKNFRKGKLLALIFGLFAFIFIVIATLYFAGMHPGAYGDDYNYTSGPGPHDSFMGSAEMGFGGVMMEGTWGPDIGWVASVIGFIFAFIGFLIAYRMPPTEVRPPIPLMARPQQFQQTSQPHYQQQQYPPQPPPQQPQPPQLQYSQQYPCRYCQQPLTYMEQYQRW
jgi:hypothetical protein